MSKNNSKLLDAKHNSINHMRMYKANGYWKVVGFSTLALGAAVLGTSLSTVNVHADTTSSYTSDQTTTGSSNALGGQSAAEQQASSTVNSANTKLNGDVSSYTGAVSQTTDQTVNITGSNANSVSTSVSNDVTSQINKVSTVGSNDSAIDNAAQSVSSVTSNVGGSITKNSASDVTATSDSTINSTGSSIVSNLSQTGSANTQVSNFVSNNSSVISAAGGTLKPGSAVDTSKLTSAEVDSLVSHASNMVNATGSADSALISASNQNTSNINAVGGSLSRGSAINTADNMTSDQIKSILLSQVSNISATGSADSLIKQAVDNAKNPISNASAVLTAGSQIDTSSMTPEQIASIAIHQSQMLSATASGDNGVVDAINKNSGVISNAGGSITQSGTINTADNMTPSQIDSLAKSQITNIIATGSGDALIISAANKYKDSITQAGGALTPGSAIDLTGLNESQINSIATSIANNINAVGSADSAMVSQVKSALPIVGGAGGIMSAGSALDASSMTPDQIASEQSNQSAMISATASADSNVSNTANNAKSGINANGGTIKQSGNINTADNMTPEQIASTVASQNARINQTASGDIVIDSTVKSNASAISNTGGVERPGSAIDTTNMTASEIASIVFHQSTMVSATGSADSTMTSTVNSANPSFSNNGGKLTQSGTVNTADNMTPEEIASHVLSQVTNISNTASANEVVGSTVKSNASSISGAGGVEKPGSAINTNSLSPDEIASIVKHQSIMVSTTGSADVSVSNTANSASSDITANGGTIKQSGTINTADNMNPYDIESTVKSQNSRISATASADSVINSTVKSNASAISGLNGVERPGSAIDTTSMSSDEIESITRHQSTMVSATGSADTAVSNGVQSNRPTIEGAGGTITQSGTINTADNMNPAQIASTVQSQLDRINQTASGDAKISSTVISNASSISGAGGIERPGSAIDTTKLTNSEIESIVSHQSTMVSATGSADSDVSYHASSAKSAIVAGGGTITQSGTVNTADNMTPEQISNHVQNQDTLISKTASGNIVVSNTVASNHDSIYNAGGIELPGSAIDVTNMTSQEIDSIVSHQSEMVSVTGYANGYVKSDLVSVYRSDIEAAGGSLTSYGHVNTADNMNVSDVIANANSQGSRISLTASGDVVISNVVKSNHSVIYSAGGIEQPGSHINTGPLTDSQIVSIVAKQYSMVSVTGSADYDVTSTADSVRPQITGFNGTLSQAGTINTADNWTVSQVISHVTSQDSVMELVGSGDVVLSNAEKSATPIVTSASGSLRPGSAIDLTKFNPDQINSIISHQSNMISVTASADSDVYSNANSARSDIEANQGTITLSGNVNTADNWTVDQVLSHMQSQDATISQTTSGDKVISYTVASNSGKISYAEGIKSYGSVIDTTSMTSEQISSITSHQSRMVSATGSADSETMSTVDANRSYINTAGGTISHYQDINTAINMDPTLIDSHVKSRDVNINSTGSADSLITSAQNSANYVSNPFGGSVFTSSAVDVTQWTLSQISSLASSESHKISIVGSNNPELSNNEKSVTPSVNYVKGTVQKGSVVDVTSWSFDSIISFEQSQSALLSAVGSNDWWIGSASDAQTKSIRDAAAIISLSGTSNFANTNPDIVHKFASSQVDNITQTGQGDYNVSVEASNVIPDITNYSGVVTKNPASDVYSLSGSTVKSLADSTVDNLSGTHSATIEVSTAQVKSDDMITNFGGQDVKGAPINVAGMVSSQILSLADSEVATLSATASGDSKMSSASVSANPNIYTAKGSVTRDADTNTAPMSVDSIISLADSQTDNLIHVGSADSQLNSGSSYYQQSMASAGGIIHIGQDTNAQNQTDDWMASFAQSQLDQMSYAALANSQVGSHYSQQRGQISLTGGWISSAPAFDATGWDSYTHSSNAQSQADRIDAVGSGDSMISSAALSAYGTTTTRGNNSDVTALQPGAILNNAQSQVTMISATQNAVNTIGAAMGNVPGIDMAGGQINDAGTVDTTNMTPGGVQGVVQADVNALQDANAADMQLVNAINQAQDQINDFGGQVTQAGNQVGGTGGAGAQAANITATGQADQTMSNALAQVQDATNFYGAPIYSLGAASDVTGQDAGTINSYGQGVAGALTAAKAYNDQLTQFANSLQRAGYKINYGNTITVSNANQIPNGMPSVPQIPSYASVVQVWGSIGNGSYGMSNSISQFQYSLSAGNTEVNDAASSANKQIDSMIKTARSENITASYGSLTIPVTTTAQINSVVSTNQSILKSAESAAKKSNLTLDKFNSDPKGTTTNGNSDKQIAVNYNGEANNMSDKVSFRYNDSKGTAEYLAPKLDPTQVVQGIEWKEGMSPTVVSGKKGQYYNVHRGANNNKIITTDYSKDNDGDQKTDSTHFSVTNGTVLKFPNAVTLGSTSRNTTKTSLFVKIEADGDKLGSNPYIDVYRTEKGAIAVNTLSVPVNNSSTNNTNSNTMTFSIGDKDGSKKYAFAAKIYDIDALQTESFGNAAVIGLGGSVQLSGNKAISKTPQNLPNSGTEQGSISVAYYGNNWSAKIQNSSDSATSGDVAQGLFGEGSSIPLSPQGVKAEFLNMGVFQNPDVTLNSNVPIAPVTINPVQVAVNPLSTTYTAYSVNVHQNYNYTYTPLSTSYNAQDVTTTPLSTHYSVLSDVGGITPFSTDYTPYSTGWTAIDNIGGYNPETMGTTPLSTTWKSFSSDGTKINPYLTDSNGNSTGQLNPEFTGYTPLSMTYKNYSSDGKDIPPVNPDGTINEKFTGYTPLSTTFKNYETDGRNIPTTNPDGSPNEKFTGYAPLDATYKTYSTDGSYLHPYTPDGQLNRWFTGYTPLSVKWQNYSTDGTNINPYITDENGKSTGKLNPKFTGYTPLSTTYANYVTDGTNINPYIVDKDGHSTGQLNPLFTGYTPLSTTWKSYSTDGTNIPVYLENGKLNPQFTGYTPFDTTWMNYETDGTNINPYLLDENGNPTGKLNPKFTGYTPLSTTWKNYSSDGSKVPDGHKFTGFRPLKTKYIPLTTTYKTFSSDGQKINPYLPDGSLNPAFTGYAPLSTKYRPFSSDGTTINPYGPVGPDGKPTLNPNFTGYTPYSTQYTPFKANYHYYRPNVHKVPFIPTPKPKHPTPPNPTPHKPGPGPKAPNNPAKPAPRPQTPIEKQVNPKKPLVGSSTPQKVLPQTGAEKQALALLGFATLAMATGLAVLEKRKKRDDENDDSQKTK